MFLIHVLISVIKIPVIYIYYAFISDYDAVNMKQKKSLF